MRRRRSLFFPFLSTAALASVIITHLSLTSLGNATSPTDLTILYLHGGSYKNPARSYHYDFLHDLDLALKVEGKTVRLVAPDYPLAPKHTYMDAYSYLDSLYPSLRTDSENLVLMGDSAGGGLALAYAEYLAEQGKDLPDSLVLISPWLDLSMQNPEIKTYQKVDKTLNLKSLKKSAKNWAGDTDLTDPKLSPLFGSVGNLPKTLIFAGGSELFLPDIQLFASHLTAADIEHELIIKDSAQHIYPLRVAERPAATEKIVEFIK